MKHIHYKVITRPLFEDIKKFTEPRIRGQGVLIAKKFHVSNGTVSRITRTPTFEAYDQYRKQYRMQMQKHAKTSPKRTLRPHTVIPVDAKTLVITRTKRVPMDRTEKLLHRIAIALEHIAVSTQYGWGPRV